MENQIVEYIEQAKKHGLSELEIKQNLLNAGWGAGEVEQGLIYAKASENNPVTFKTDELKTAHRDFEASLQNQINPPQEAVAYQNLTETAQPTQSYINPQVIQNAQSQPKSKHSALLLLFILIGITLLSGAGYAAYWYYSANPNVILKKIVTQPKVFSNTFKISYSDNGKEQKDKIIAKLEGNGYFDTRNASSTKLDVQFTASLQTGEQSLSRDFKLLSTGDAVYVKLGKLDQLDQMVGKSVDWLKLDINKLNEFASSTGISEQERLKQQEKLTKAIEDNLKKNQFLTPDKKVLRETLDNVPVYHLSYNFNEEKFKAFVSKFLDDIRDITKEDNKNNEINIDGVYEQIKAGLNKFMDPFEVKQIELWVGRKDYRIYRMLFVSNAPSLSGIDSTEFNPLASARAKSRDAKRLADMRQLASALELYFNDNNGYPEGKDGIPQGLSPYYIGLIPNAPSPAGGNCTDYYNTYWYQPKGQPTNINGKNVYQNYEYTFCLGQAIGGYTSGINMLDMRGIQPVDGCPAGDQTKCFKAADNTAGTDKPDFSAQFIFDNTYNNFDQEKAIVPPPDSLDIIDLLTGSLKSAQDNSRDAKRLADVRMMASALELYFNDKNSYPVKLSDLAPNYIGAIPAAPIPPNGKCSESDNNYNYLLQSPDKYELTFCLGDNTGGYSAGKHILSPFGIQ